MITVARPVALASVGLAVISAPAFAHAHLRSATPPIGATVSASPPELDLVFSEGLDLRFSGATITGPDKRPVSTGTAALGAGRDTTLVVPITGSLVGGAYTVTWHALSTDGHKTSGAFTFTVKP